MPFTLRTTECLNKWPTVSWSPDPRKKKLMDHVKVCLKESLAVCHIADPERAIYACDRNICKRIIHEATRIFQEHPVSWANVKSADRKWRIIDPAIQQLTCDECVRVCLSSADLVNHKKSHVGRPLTNYDQYYVRNNMRSTPKKLKKKKEDRQKPPRLK